MHSALRANQLNNFASSSNALSISKCLFPYNKKPELTNEQYDHDHTLMGCCNIDYRNSGEDILMSRHNRQLTTFSGLNATLNQAISEIENTNLQLTQSVAQDHLQQQQQQFRELNTRSMHFNTYNQLTNSLTTTNLAGSSCSTRDLYDTCLYNNMNSLSNLPSSSLALAAGVAGATANTIRSSNNLNTLRRSSNNCSSPDCPPPLTPPPSYEASTSMLSLPAPPSQSLLSNTSNKIYETTNLTNSLLQHHHHHHHSINHQPYIDYTNRSLTIDRYQSFNKVHPKLEEFKQNNLVVNLDVCTSFKNNFKSLDRLKNLKETSSTTNAKEFKDVQMKETCRKDVLLNRDNRNDENRKTNCNLNESLKDIEMKAADELNNNSSKH